MMQATALMHLCFVVALFSLAAALLAAASQSKIQAAGQTRSLDLITWFSPLRKTQLLATSNLTIHPHSSARLASHNRLSYMHMTASESEACRLPSGVASILEAIHSFDTPPFEKGGF